MSIINNKKFQPVLITLVVALWFTIAYKVYDNLAEEDDSQIQNRQIRRVTTADEEESQWTSDFNFKDPFLKRRSAPKSTKKVAQKKVAPEPVEKPAFGLNISYQGRVKRPNSSTSLAIILSEGKTQFLEVNQTFKTYTLQTMTEDSLVFGLNGFKYTVKK